MRYLDKVVIITGAGSGIGKGCAQEFLKAGAQVVLSGNDEEEGRAAAAALKSRAHEQGAGHICFAFCDVRIPQHIRNLIEAAAARYGRIDCLINNAGWHPPHRPIDRFSLEDLQDLLILNLVSVFVACQCALPYLRQSRGNIINISSLVAQIGQYHAPTYAATKGAVTALTKALAIDEAVHGVRVNSVSPGNIDTPLLRRAIQAAPDPECYREEVVAAQLLGRMGSAEEVGRLCLFIAAEATFTTGVDHIISGGCELGYGCKYR